MIRRPPRSPLFPYPPLSRSIAAALFVSRTLRQQRHAALHDALTGLANRVLLNDRINESLERARATRSEEHTSELQSQSNLVCRLLLEKKNTIVHGASSFLGP